VRAKPITRLLASALAFTRRTSVRLYDVVCTSFDKRHYAECDPLHVVHKRGCARGLPVSCYKGLGRAETCCATVCNGNVFVQYRQARCPGAARAGHVWDAGESVCGAHDQCAGCRS